MLLCCQPQFLSLNFLQLSTAATASPVFHVIGTRVDSIRLFPDATLHKGGKGVSEKFLRLFEHTRIYVHPIHKIHFIKLTQN